MSRDDSDSTVLDRRRFIGTTGAGLLGAALPGSAGASSGDDGDGGGGGGEPPPGEGSDGGDPIATLTLVTGDRLYVSAAEEDGERAVSVAPADRGDYEPSFEMIEDGGDAYVIPSDAAPLIPDTLDRELFNVTKLAELEPHVDDGTVPTIVTYPERAAVRTMDSATGVRSARRLSSVDGSALSVDAASFWRAVTDDADAASTVGGPAGAGTLSGVEKVWLDEPVFAELHDSVDQVGAPAAWDAGYDGSGVTVAVLDTGIDESHDDLDDEVVAAANFSPSDTVDDRYGHGTHVAATVAGSGDASGGDRTGVAPGADLVNAKVLGDTGSGSTSGIIEGMEWAAGEQDADVINMSLGSSPTDGTDPLSVAVDNVTDEHGTLFVVSAGNSGPGDESVTAPGSADAALTVGAVDDDGELASFSSRGPRVGDYAVKPDLTAPGVDIVAARADGTGLGSPVDEAYTELSGTSMAAPHAAGSAAILAQQRPDWEPASVKAALASTAAPADDLTVYEQGGGELDVAAAVETEVVATPSPVDLGFHEYPHDGSDPVTETLTYTNHGDDAVDLGLSAALTDDEGTPAPDGMVSLDPGNVTVDPGASVDVDVTLDLAAGDVGLYGGWITATADGGTVAATPTGFYKEAERYDLTIEGIARDGRDAARASSVEVMNVDDRAEFFESSVGFTDGVASVRVPSGTYSVTGVITTLDENDAFFLERVLVGDPEFEVTGDTELTLDAREANAVEVDTMHDRAVRSDGAIAYSRAPEEGNRYTHSWSGDTPVFAVSTDEVTTGEFEFYTEHNFEAPELVTRAVDPETLEVAADYMTDSPELAAGEHEWELLPAGLGYPEDFEGVDVEGEMALVERGEFSFADKAKNAAEAGAEAAIIYNDAPGDFNGTLAGEGVIPTFELSGSEGEALLDLTEGGDASFEVVATPVSPFYYDLVLPEPDAIPEDLQYDVGEDDVATVPAAFHSDVADHAYNHARSNWRPYEFIAFNFLEDLAAPQERVEYVSANDTRWQRNLYGAPPFTGEITEPVTYYDGGEQRDESWFEQPARPGLLEGTDTQVADVPSRDGDSLDLNVPEWTDGQTGLHRHWGFRDAGVDETAFRLYEDGDLVAEADRAFGEFEVSGGPSRLRMELDVSRDADWWETSTETATAWEFDSATTSGEELLPLLLVDYEMDLDLRNRAPKPSDRTGPFTIALHARHPRGVDDADVAEMRVWTSHDDGATWRERNARDLGDGHYEVHVDRRNPKHTSGYVSLRVEARDANGSRIEQEIRRAYRLTPRN